MAFKEYGGYDGMGLAELVRKKQVSARELLDETIARTTRVEPQINAVVVKHYDYAERQIDNGLPHGPFTGVPFLLKDLDILEGTRTTSGASVYKDNVADHTSTLARRFLDAGVTIFGKSSSPEFGLMPTTESRLFGPTRNPWNLALHSDCNDINGFPQLFPTFKKSFPLGGQKELELVVPTPSGIPSPETKKPTAGDEFKPLH